MPPCAGRDDRKWEWRRRAAAVLAFVAVAGYSFGARADYFDLSPEQLMGAEVISASKKPETVARTPAAVYVISQEDIARTGVTSIPDALRMVPGVDVAQGDANSWAINIRGFNKGLANQLLVMIDGRTVYNPLFGGTYWELQNLPLEDIARIEVVRGPGGTLWGANAVNGVINIITKSAQDTQGKLIVAGAGNIETDFLTARQGGKTDGGGYYRVYAKHFNRAPFVRPSGGGAGDAWHDNRAGFRYDRDNLMVQGDTYLNQTNALVSVPQLTSPYAVVRQDHMNSRGADILARWKKPMEDGALLTLQSYLDYTQREQVTLNDQRGILDADAQYDMAPRGRHEITLGGGFRMTQDDLGNSPTLSFNPSGRTDRLYSAFAQDKITLAPEEWFLTLGSKVEHNDYTGFEFQPDARLMWTPDESQTVWASASRAVRTPTRLEHDIDLNARVFAPTPPDPNPLKFELTANPEFQSEQLIAYEAGYRRQVTPEFSVDVTAFANNYRGLAAQKFVGLTVVSNGTDPTFYQFATTQDNLMSAETWGAEAAAEWQARSNWKLSASYGLLNMFIHLPNDFTNQQAQERVSPRNQLSVRSYWNVSDTVTLDTSAYYVERLDALAVPSHVRVDVNLGWRIRHDLQFNLVGQNLLESRHREFGDPTDASSVLNTAEIPRSIFGKFTCRF